MTKTISKQLDALENPTLEDILIALYGKKTPMFVKNPRRDREGNVINVFTRAGGKAYSDLTALLYAVGRLTGNTHDANDMVEDLDEISNDPCY